MESYIAGLDIGGTTGRVLLKSIDGRVLGEFYGEGCSINTDGSKKSEERYRALVLPALEKTGLRPQDCNGICIAASGIDSPELEQDCRRAFLNMGFKDHTIIVQNDCEIFLNLSPAPLLVLVAGTGSICYGKTVDNTVVRTGGWGHIVSDEGSGFYIGLNIMKYIGDHIDGRREYPVLYKLFYEQTGIKDLSELNEFINDNLMDKAVIGALAPLAERSFEAGEDAGECILYGSARVLSELVKDTCKKMKLEQEAQAFLWLWGSVLVHNKPLRTHLEKLILSVYPNMTIRIPETRALDVAVSVAGNLKTL